jgi:4-amino-4-deoxy-L-arabinose transferase-like glycosyltransferase
VASMAFHLHFARGVTYYTRADEGYYFLYASTVSSQGIQALPGLVANYIRVGSGMFPPPTRAGWILPSALALKLGGGNDPFPIGVLSTLFLGGTVLAVFTFLRLHLRGRTALVAASLVAFSPLLGGMARRILQDSAVAFLAVATAFCFYQALKTRSVLWCSGYGASLCWLLVTKEAGLLILPFLAGYAAWWKLRADRHAHLRALAAATGLAGAASLAVYVALCGNLAAVVALARILFGSPATNAYALANNSGPWFRNLVDLMSVSPMAIVLAIGFSFHFLVSRNGKAGRVEGFLVAFLVGLLAVHSVTIKNVRYILAAEVPLRALAACAVVSVHDAWPRRGVALGLAILVVVAVACDILIFYRIFIAGAVYDPVTGELLRALEMLPR